jgi:hypothetical protein
VLILAYIINPLMVNPATTGLCSGLEQSPFTGQQKTV